MKLSKLFETISFLVFCLSLGGCAVFIPSYGRFHPAEWHGQNMSEFLYQNYPEGSDQQKLIKDFRMHGYIYSEAKECANAPLCGRSLALPAYCSWFFPARKGVNIDWLPDENGKITHLTTNDTFCLLTP